MKEHVIEPPVGDKTTSEHEVGTLENEYFCTVTDVAGHGHNYPYALCMTVDIGFGILGLRTANTNREEGEVR